jgi:hypothetical protein
MYEWTFPYIKGENKNCLYIKMLNANWAETLISVEIEKNAEMLVLLANMKMH